MIVSTSLKLRIRIHTILPTLLHTPSLFKTCGSLSSLNSTHHLKYASVYVPRRFYATKFFKRKTIDDFKEENKDESNEVETQSLEVTQSSNNDNDNNNIEPKNSDHVDDEELVSLSSFDWKEMSEDLSVPDSKAKKAWNFGKKKDNAESKYIHNKTSWILSFALFGLVCISILFYYNPINLFHFVL